MSGHSHARTILHKKQITDAKRGQIFSKLSREISVATREGGGNPETNTKLRLVIEKAKGWNLPKDNIERAIKRGTGELAGEKLEEILVEAYGPGGIALIVKGITDNKNRALSEIKQVLFQNNSKLVGEGSVQWLFEMKGVIGVQNMKPERLSKDELELKVIEAGAEDVYWRDDNVDVYAKKEDLERVKKNLEKEGIKIGSASLDWVAKESIQVEEKDREAAQKLFEALDELDGVQEIYSNLKI